MVHFPLIDISGTPFERGEQYGRQAANQIRRSLDLYIPVFARGGHQWPAVRQIAAQIRPRIEAFAADMLEEIAGIARGSDVEIEDIIALNARTEMMYGSTRPEDIKDETDEGCTGVIALPSTTQDGHVIHGQNWDWQSECEHSTIVLRIRRTDGPDILTMVEAGMLARCGMNSAGVAITGNFLKCQHDFGRSGVPVPMVRRAMLSQATFTEAMRILLTAPRSFSTNIMISHVGGEAIDLEATPPEVFWVRPQDGLLVHSNHFLSPGALAKMTDLGLLVTPDSLYRDERVRRTLAARRGAIAIADLKEVFADRYGAPYAVCRSPVVNSTGSLTSTVASIVMDVTARTAIIAVAPFRGAEYWEYDFMSKSPRRV
jgi:isopenicillin-N N-acyltransferase-like protein